ELFVLRHHIARVPAFRHVHAALRKRQQKLLGLEASFGEVEPGHAEEAEIVVVGDGESKAMALGEDAIIVPFLDAQRMGPHRVSGISAGFVRGVAAREEAPARVEQLAGLQTLLARQSQTGGLRSFHGISFSSWPARRKSVASSP